MSFAYQRDDERHVYGESTRWAAERLLVKHINELHESRPEFKMKLLGTSGVHGEKFPVFRTKCEFELPDKASVAQCYVALKQSDELIRRRVEPAWNWEMAWEHETQILFFVNWFDFAYFMKNKEIFLGKDHSRYALDFDLDVRSIKFEHLKIFRDGTSEIFDEKKISAREKEIVENLDKIEFSKVFRERRF